MQTFLFTDIADSTLLWQRFPEAMSRSLAAHDAILARLIPEHRGRIVKSTGDGVHAAFDQVRQAALAAVAVQQALAEQHWKETGPLQVRMGLHTGDAEQRDGDYYGTAVNKAARVMSLAAGGQVLLTDVAHALVQENPPPGVGGRELGKLRLKGLAGKTGLYQLLHPDLPDNFPPLRTGDSIPNNLPERMTPFIGREREMDILVNYLVDTDADLQRRRLVTLIGPGGTGKTRLSIHAARAVREAFPDGVWLIELAALTDPQAVPQAVLDVLGLQETPDSPALKLIASYLKARQALLIFDNCEHLVEASAGLIEQTLKAAPLVQVLASSREALGTYGETVLRIPSLPLPESEKWEHVLESEAVRLFADRAEAAGAGRWISPEHAQAIAQICRRLDGIPLALEMAAARLRVFSPAQILERLDDRFRLLTGGSRTALPRLQTLQALIDWSYDLLDDEEKALLQELSVFAGGWTIDMAMDVCPERDVLTLLPQLAEKSLVVAEPGEEGMHFSFLETIRQYARDRLMESGRSAEVLERHLAYFLSFTRTDSYWDQAYLETHFLKLAPQLENLRAALNWGLESDPLAALELAGNMTLLWSFGLAKEGLDWITQALARVRPEPERVDAETIDPERARIFTWALLSRGSLLFALGRNRDGLEDSKLGLTFAYRLGDPNLICLLNGIVALASIQIGEFKTAQSSIEEGLQLAEAHGSNYVNGMLLNIKGLIKLSAERDIAGARVLMERAVELDPATAKSVTGLFPLIKIANLSQDWERSRQLVAMGLQIVEEAYDLDKRRFFNMYNAERGHIERLAGNLDAAEHMYGRLIVSYKELGMEPAVANLLECFAMIAVQKGRPRRAARLFGAAEALREQVGADMTMLERMEYGMSVGQLKGMMDAGELDSVWKKGRNLDIDKGIALALEYANPEPDD